MNFIEILLSNSKLKEARLYNAAKKAAANPETGVTIKNRAAYHVIKDCAITTVRYLPHYVFAHYTSPFTELYGKFTKADIEQFVKVAGTDYSLSQLLNLILDKIEDRPLAADSDKDTNPNFDVNISDPYGDYGVTVDIPEKAEITDPVELLCHAFGAK